MARDPDFHNVARQLFGSFTSLHGHVINSSSRLVRRLTIDHLSHRSFLSAVAERAINNCIFLTRVNLLIHHSTDTRRAIETDLFN